MSAQGPTSQTLREQIEKVANSMENMLQYHPLVELSRDEMIHVIGLLRLCEQAADRLASLEQRMQEKEEKTLGSCGDVSATAPDRTQERSDGDAPQRPKVITDLLAVDDTGVVANYIRRLESK